MLWALTDHRKLSLKVKAILEDPHHEIFVSAVTFWEISLKFALGKLDLQGLTPNELPKAVIDTGFALLPLQPQEAASYHELNADWHRDPFDRMLIQQAILNKLILLSKDKNVAQYQSTGLKVIW
ncbi:MAG: domain nuclease [Mucilaginibacter sp.]|nr:domain nuclease [Mucilaginibacter sp.]